MTTGYAPRRRLRSTAVRLAAKTASLTAAALLLATPAASATTTPGENATPFNEGGEWWSTDGCTAVSDSGYHTTVAAYGQHPFYAYRWVVGYYDFHHACKHHDGCYRYHWSDRATCDMWFHNDMRASCDALGSNQACYARADLYYRGVRALGQHSWNTYDSAVPMNP